MMIAEIWIGVGAALATYSYATAWPPGLFLKDAAIGWITITLVWPIVFLPLRD